jgi:sugar O-acyltransferase (sialic acid O-acetyltransferase NeuD family)
MEQGFRNFEKRNWSKHLNLDDYYLNNIKKMKKGIIGYGGFAREVKALLIDNNPDEKIDFFVDDEYCDENSKPISQLNVDEYEVIVAIGDPHIRKKMVSKLPENTKYFSAIHKSVQILDDNIIIGEGSIICSSCILTTNIKLGKHTHLNLQTTIGHDVEIGEYFTTAPGVKISGNCLIGNNVYVGTNSSIREKITICDDVILGLNSGVIKNITEAGVYGGTPCKKIK